MLKNAPNPNAARLLQNFMFTAEASSDDRFRRRCAPCIRAAKEKDGRRPLKDIKLMKDDPAGVEKKAEDIKARYTQILQGVTP